MIKKLPGCSWASRQTMRWGPAFEGSHESDVCDVAQPRLRVVAASGSSHWACWALGSLRPCRPASVFLFLLEIGERLLHLQNDPSTRAGNWSAQLQVTASAQESSHISTSKTQLKSRIMRIQMAPMSNFNFGHRTHWTHRSWNPHFGTLHPLVGGLQTPCCRRESLP